MEGPKRKRRKLSEGVYGYGDGDVGSDLISGLPDELLEHILGLLPTAADAIRTSALSQRWRHVWTRAPTLRFHSGPRGRRRAPGAAGTSPSFARFVDGALSQHASASPAMDSLEISVTHKHYARRGRERVNAWLRDAMARVVKSFKLSMKAKPQPQPLGPSEEPEDAAIELPACGRAASISLSLGFAGLKFPFAADGAFDALVELDLHRVLFGRGNPLGLFVRWCCPRLRKLRVASSVGLEELDLETEVLQELDVCDMPALMWLRVAAANLRALHVDDCFGLWPLGSTGSRIAAPRLEELEWSNVPFLPTFESGDATSVRCLKNLRLHTHGLSNGAYNRSSIELLKLCTRLDRLDVHLVTQIEKYGLHEHQDKMGEVPQLPNITIMNIMVSSSGHSFGASVATLLARCSGLQTLQIHIYPVLSSYATNNYFGYGAECSSVHCFCDRPWNWRNRISLGSLQKVEIRGFTGADCEIDLVKLLFVSSVVLETMTITFSGATVPSKRACKNLLFAPGSTRGRWTRAVYVYKWTKGVEA